MSDRATSRSISHGAEQLLGKVFKIHELGELELVDYMGDERAIARAARTSYQGSEGKSAEADLKLIRRLWVDKHTSPFEMVVLTFRILLPIFVMRQHVRHRTASLNEWSFRYTKCPDLFFVPAMDNVRTQHKSNKQMSGANLETESASEAREKINKLNKDAYRTYLELLNMGVAREQARVVLPVSAYTQIIWKCDMRNLLGYLRLRLAPDAQKEIRDYAGVIADIVKKGWPMIWEAYEETS
ncbi:Thymidylate synthase ThyX [hydrothermal vent metagenome]|uniref:Thymidylate synthase ThyX n=1 Tax=hydrothermal vent metagenome TaxID=652676 RepID=A0A3B1BWL4_9ZZZZ